MLYVRKLVDVRQESRRSQQWILHKDVNPSLRDYSACPRNHWLGDVTTTPSQNIFALPLCLRALRARGGLSKLRTTRKRNKPVDQMCGWSRDATSHLGILNGSGEDYNTDCSCCLLNTYNCLSAAELFDLRKE